MKNNFMMLCVSVILVAVTTILGIIRTHFQQIAIDNLIANAKVAETYDVASEYYIQALQATLDRHIEDGCIAQQEEAKIIKRIDLAVRQVDQMTREFQ